jgi:CrcB protein
MPPLNLYLAVLLGSALGGVARFFLSGLIGSQFGEAFPWGTVLVNITGSFVIGFVAGLSAPGGRVALSPAMRLFLMTGVCGGYTTFSAFSLQTFTLLGDGHWGKAGANVVGSVGACVLATWLGYIAATAINPTKAA